MAETVALVLVGNELLSGKVQDLNCVHAMDDLRRIGGTLGEVVIIPDIVETIAATVRRCSESHRWVVTSGGIGPTHDDMTADGIAAAFGVPLEEHPGLRAMIESYYRAQDKEVNEWVLKMARLPAGAEVVPDPLFPIPIVRVENVFCLPGEPTLFKRKWAAIRERFQSTPLIQARLYLDLEETPIAHLLADVEREEQVAIGSYPLYHKADYKVMVTIESPESGRVEAAFRRLRGAFAPEAIVRVAEPRSNAEG